MRGKEEPGMNEGAILTGCVCPGCGAALYEVVANETTILSCLSCGGLAASRAQVETMLTRRWGETARSAARARAAASRAGRTPACPRCGNGMEAATLGPPFRLRVDWCARCDLVWFGRDELAALGLSAEPAEPAEG